MRILLAMGGLLALCAAVLAACPALRARSDRSEGTARMIERLNRITAEADPKDNPFMNARRVEQLETYLKSQPRPSPRNIMELGQEKLNAGRTSEAIEIFDHLVAMLRERKMSPTSQPWVEVRLKQAVANLRRGEEENCTLHHNAKSCIFPIRDAGVHMQPRGSRAAADILIDLLKSNPDNLQARWLLNIAFMTLGEYPQGVPSRWLLDPALFASDYDIKPFPDIAGKMHLDIDDLAGGTVTDDFDGDGYTDIMVSSMGFQTQLRYFHNNADGTFSDRTDAAGLKGLTGGLNIVQSDYDNDGDLDLLVLRGGWLGRAGRYPNSLLRNNGDGTFSDVTEDAGLLSYHPTQTGVWRDFDGDGWLDLYIGNESTAGDPHPCELYHNNGDGTFAECAADAGVAITEFVKGVAGGDYDNDGRPDIYVSVRGGDNHLFHNDGTASAAAGKGKGGTCRMHFTDVAKQAGVTEPFYSFPTWFFDYDNDGWEDIFVSGYMSESVGDIAADYLGLPNSAELPRLYHNRGNGTFEDVTQAAHLAHVILSMGSNYGDFDNDGWLDFLLGTGNPDFATLVPDRAFRNAGGRFFQDVTTSGGFGHLQKGHGVSFADLDNDGDQDIYHSVGGALEADGFRNVLYENPGHGNHFIVLKLEGVKSNRAAIGARINVVVQTPAGERSIRKTVSNGGSFGGSPLRQEIGLGDASRILRVEILWPAGAPVQVLSGLALDTRYSVREGQAGTGLIALRTLHLGGAEDESSERLAGKPADAPSGAPADTRGGGKPAGGGEHR